MTKKLISLLLAIIMCVSTFSVSVFADSTEASEATETETKAESCIVVGNTLTLAGSTVTINVDVTNNPGIAGARIFLDYDSQLTLKSVNVGETFATLDYTAPPSLKSGCAFNWDSLFQEVTEDGTLLTLTFDVSESAEGGEKLDVTVSYIYGDIYDTDLNSLSFDVINGYVEIIDYIPGDVNGDLTVNGKDVTLLRRYNAKYNVTLNTSAADVNDDGTINGKDITLIRRYVAGYDVELLPSTSKKEHSLTSVEAKSATCTEDGNIAYWHCTDCGKYFSDKNATVEISADKIVIPATGHQYGEWVVVKEATTTEAGLKEKVCLNCGDKVTEEIPVKEVPDATEYTVTYDLNGGSFVGGYTSTAQIGEAFLADFNKYGNTSAKKESFHSDSSAPVKVALANSEMLEKWNWLWVYMLAHLQEYNEGKTSEYIVDTYPILQRMIDGDTTAIGVSANARTSIRSYIHGLLNSMKGCGDENTTFAVYSPDFSLKSVQEEFLKHQYNLTVTLAHGAELPVPVRSGYQFIGWKNKSGNILSKATCDGTLTAVWKELNPVQKIEITNKVEELHLDSTYQLKWVLTPNNAGEQRVTFKSSNTSVASIDENGLITTHRVGKVTFTITSLSQNGYTDTMTVNVVTPGYFNISYETVSYVTIGSKIKLNATYIDTQNKTCSVEWKSLDGSRATVDANGYVTGKAAGVVKIRATAKGHADEYQDFVVTILPENISEGLKLVLDAHESNIFVKYNLPVGAGTPSYYSDIFGSVSRLLYNKALEIDYTYNKKSNEKYGSDLPSRVMESIEFIVVHYTGNFSAGADGDAHGAWFAEPKSENNTSIHYSTGNDGVFKGLDEQYRAAHAGDDGSRNTVSKFSWIDTPVVVLDTDPEFPVVTITSNATFAINGRDTGVKVPVETKYGRGYVTDSKWLNDQGIGVNIKDGKYQIGTSWWCYTQVGEGRICSNGGNRNSIGIESAVNKGSDLWYTWQITAQLVADIMERHNLDITKVKAHHFFSAKDCPQPMLENDLEIWWEFIELVKCEYAKITTCADYDFRFECDSALVNEHGRVTGQANNSQVVTYTVTITKDGKTETIELASIIEGAHNNK